MVQTVQNVHRSKDSYGQIRKELNIKIDKQTQDMTIRQTNKQTEIQKNLESLQ